MQRPRVIMTLALCQLVEEEGPGTYVQAQSCKPRKIRALSCKITPSTFLRQGKVLWSRRRFQVRYSTELRAGPVQEGMEFGMVHRFAIQARINPWHRMGSTQFRLRLQLRCLQKIDVEPFGAQICKMRDPSCLQATPGRPAR